MGRNGERIAFEKDSWDLKRLGPAFDYPWVCPICKEKRFSSYKNLKAHKIEAHSYWTFLFSSFVSFIIVSSDSKQQTTSSIKQNYKTTLVNTKDLKPDPNNPNVMTARQLSSLKYSMEKTCYRQTNAFYLKWLIENRCFQNDDLVSL